MVAEPEFGTSAVDFAALLDQPLLPRLAAGRVTSLNLGGGPSERRPRAALGKRAFQHGLEGAGAWTVKLPSSGLLICALFASGEPGRTLLCDYRFLCSWAAWTTPASLAPSWRRFAVGRFWLELAGPSSISLKPRPVPGPLAAARQPFVDSPLYRAVGRKPHYLA